MLAAGAGQPVLSQDTGGTHAFGTRATCRSRYVQYIVYKNSCIDDSILANFAEFPKIPGSKIAVFEIWALRKVVPSVDASDSIAFGCTLC